MKNKKSALKIVLNLLVIVFFLMIVAAGSLASFLYGKYKINIFNCIDQIAKLNENVNVATLVTKQPTEADYNSVKTKIQTAEDETATILSFTDRELCAYLSKHLDQIGHLQIGNTEFNLEDCGLEVLQIALSNIPTKQPNEHYCDMNVVLKLNVASIKGSTMSGFPANMLKNFLPNDLYISANWSIDKVNDAYQTTTKGITVNNLSENKTKSFFGTLNQLTSFPTAEGLNQNLATIFSDALLSSNGLYGYLCENKATGYGWQSENEFVVYFVDITKTYAINYNIDSHNVNNPNQSEYTVLNNRIYLEDLTDNGYKFLGWFTNVSGEKVKVETIETSTMQEYNLYCEWEIIHYIVICNLRGGTIDGKDTYSKEYTVEYETFKLPTNAELKINATKTLPFWGWSGSDLTEITKDVTIARGSYGNKSYEAHYIGEEVNLTMNVDGVAVREEKFLAGTVLSLNQLNNLVKDKLSGYTINNWYTNDTMTNEYNYGTQLVDSKIIYATANFVTDNVHFYPYLEQFQNAVENSSTLEIKSHQMLIGYIDYCIFNDVNNSGVRLHLNYNRGTNTIKEEINAALHDRNLGEYFSKGYSYVVNSDVGYGYFYLTKTDTPTNAQKHFDGNVYTQQDYALRVNDDLGVRADTYDDFEIKYIGKQIPVSTSEQLVWVMENGYQPICVADSDAEKMYLAAKQVLRDICTDEMNDIQKLYAIYQWLVLNVSYDQEALTTFSSYINQKDANDMARTYDSWYLEGVFNWGKAVCEGYAKALLVMAKLEGIPAVCVSGNGHMWNKVYIDGAWYGIDATHGDLGVNSAWEIFINTSFLFTDQYKQDCGYVATNYTGFVANTEINGYEYINFTYLNVQYDLLIDSNDELLALINYVNGFHSVIDCTYYTIDVAVATENETQFRNCFSSYMGGWGILKSEGEQITNSAGNLVFILYHTK